MNLLTPKEVKDAKQKDLSLEILRAQETEKVTKKINQRRAEAEADFNTALARHRALWAEEEQSHATRVKEMAEEVALLEERKKQALIPISLYKNQADSLFKEAEEHIKRVKEKEESLDETQELLEQKLDAVGEREISVGEEEKRLKSRKKGLELQGEELKKGLDRLTEEMKNFRVEKEASEADIAEKKKALFLWDRTLVAKEEKLVRERDGLEKWAKRLEDERTTLQRTIERLRSQGIAISP